MTSSKKRTKHLKTYILKSILPEAFAVVKEVCYRFNNNELSASTTDHDRFLAAKGKDYVSIMGETAIKNEWKQQS